MKFHNNNAAHLNDSLETPYLSFPVLSEFPFIRHGFSTKLGGVSEGIFSSMNLGFKSGLHFDEPELVKENFRRISNSIGIDPQTIVISKQVHKTNILKVDHKDCGKGLYRTSEYEEIDGLITNEPNVTLVTHYADCVPLYFVDPCNKAIGLTHSGWRGTVNKIGLVTVNEMAKHYHSNPKDMIAVIGPSICKECYEIGEEVAMEFEKVFPQSDKVIEGNSKGKYQCNLWEANRLVLLEAGIPPENIHISGVCTCCNSDLLFSHRKTQGLRGSLAAFLSITPE